MSGLVAAKKEWFYFQHNPLPAVLRHKGGCQVTAKSIHFRIRSRLVFSLLRYQSAQQLNPLTVASGPP